MKLLFDQNISHRILKLLPDSFNESQQVRTVALEGVTDLEIWNFARDNNFTIVTFDADFADIAYIRGFPPKIIWLRTGNMTTKNVANLLDEHKNIISTFILEKEEDNIACMEIE